MSTIEDADTIRSKLLEWSSNTQFENVSLSDDGSKIVHNDESLNATTKISIETNDRTCEYTAASIFLQIRDPNQGLVTYRNECKKYNVNDPIKVIDKPTVVSYFIKDGSSTTAAEGASSVTAPAATEANKESTESAAAAKEEKASASDSRKEKNHRRKSHHHDKRSSKHDHKRSRDHHHHHRSKDHSSPPPKKKKPELVSNEQLLKHLNLVVDKRHQAATGTTNILSQQDEATAKMSEAITKALSAKGFEISSIEQLKPYKEKTVTILGNEIPVGNAASILRANNPNKNLSRVLELYMETVGGGAGGKNNPKVKSPIKSTTTTTTDGKAQSTSNKTYLIGKKPVIIVPKGMTAPLTITNAHEFLCNGRYVPRNVMLSNLQKSSGSRTAPTTFTRTIKTGQSSGTGGGLLEYEIIDNPRKLGHDPKEWERIVAVIVLGQSWQFKDWLKPYNVPATLFERVFGFYVSIEGTKIPSEVNGWAVKQSLLNRDKRGLDSVTYASFWNGLDEYMKVYKSELLPQTE